MKKLLLLTVLAAITFQADAQMSEEEQKAMMEYGEVGPMQKMLAKNTGEWKEEITFWMEPGGEAMKNEATVKTEMILDGHFEKGTHTGNMMGMPFEGISITGFDNARKVFVNTWMDNFSSGLMNSEGKWDDKTKSIEFKGMTTEPVTKKLVPFRQVLYIVDENTKRMEMYMPHKGKEYKSMEIVMWKG